MPPWLTVPFIRMKCPLYLFWLIWVWSLDLNMCPALEPHCKCPHIISGLLAQATVLTPLQKSLKYLLLRCQEVWKQFGELERKHWLLQSSGYIAIDVHSLLNQAGFLAKYHLHLSVLEEVSSMEAQRKIRDTLNKNGEVGLVTEWQNACLPCTKSS